MAKINLKNPIVFFDLETTGVDTGKDRIVEVACVKIMPNQERLSYVKRINPGMPIPPSSTAIHGITDDMVKEAPLFKDIAHQLYDWMKGCDLGGYNVAKFDLPLLAEEFARAGIQVDFTTRKLIDVQQIFFKMESRTLSAAYRFYCDKELENAHSAEADVMATIDVLEAQLDRYENLENDVQALHQYLGPDQIVDYARRMVRKEDGTIVFNFGKYKGQGVEDVFKREPQYYDWIMNADFPQHTKQKCTEIFTNMKLKAFSK
jgi:DNA polymerase-3 subunit epsilon